MHRLFVAVDLTDSVKDQVSALLSGVPGAKWVKRPQLHLTLRFIGEVETAQFKAIAAALSNTRSEAFDMRLSGVGRFPPKGAPRVLWVGVEEQPALARLVERIEAALAMAGVKPDDRPFSAHITLARLKEPPPREVVEVYLAKHKPFQSDLIPVKQFTLYSSVLSPAGPAYTAERVYALG